jgi:hypothetical protein
MFSGRLHGGRLYSGRLFHRGVPPAIPDVASDHFPSGRRQPGKKSHLRHQASAGVLLTVGCSVSSSARLGLGASATVVGKIRLNSKSSIRLGAVAETRIGTSVESSADVRDIVLEMLLLAD